VHVVKEPLIHEAPSYKERRRMIQHYFDRTAVEAWARLTSTAPVSGVRATVRAGREAMRNHILSWLPEHLAGARALDAGCGTGAVAVELARRGADVVAIDLSPTLIQLARDRTPRDLGGGSIDFRAGDMLSPQLGIFDFVVSMDALIHYQRDDVVRVLEGLGTRCRRSLVFTFAPQNALLALMFGIGKLFPRSDRSPAIYPVREATLRRLITADPVMRHWKTGRTVKVSRGFYVSQALELVRR
jgi:magnesium-protoporphyrin O-methyltransferase